MDAPAPSPGRQVEGPARPGPLTPSRIGLLTIALLTLSTTLLVSSVRYPDEEFGLTIERANAINERTRAAGSGSFADCFAQAADPDRPCAVAHPHNFHQRARILGSAVVLASALIFLAFSRRYDLDGDRPPRSDG